MDLGAEPCGTVRYFSDDSLGDAEAELTKLLSTYCRPSGRIDPKRLGECVRLNDFLWDLATSDVHEFISHKQIWRMYRTNIPIFKTSGSPFVIFTIATDADGMVLVIALYFGYYPEGIDMKKFDDDLWANEVWHRLQKVY